MICDLLPMEPKKGPTKQNKTIHKTQFKYRETITTHINNYCIGYRHEQNINHNFFLLAQRYTMDSIHALFEHLVNATTTVVNRFTHM